ncbi:MAG: hypothetical protein ACFFDN_10270 [Candidatus Hodarchaeota archaeon]
MSRSNIMNFYYCHSCSKDLEPIKELLEKCPICGSTKLYKYPSPELVLQNLKNLKFSSNHTFGKAVGKYSSGYSSSGEARFKRIRR